MEIYKGSTTESEILNYWKTKKIFEKLRKQKESFDYVADGIQGTLFAIFEAEKPAYEITAEKIQENYFYIPQVKENHIQLHNRRYIGNKHKLIEWIFSIINKECSGNSFADVFVKLKPNHDRHRESHHQSFPPQSLARP